MLLIYTFMVGLKEINSAIKKSDDEIFSALLTKNKQLAFYYLVIYRYFLVNKKTIIDRNKLHLIAGRAIDRHELTNILLIMESRNLITRDYHGYWRNHIIINPAAFFDYDIKNAIAVLENGG